MDVKGWDRFVRVAPDCENKGKTRRFTAWRSTVPQSIFSRAWANFKGGNSQVPQGGCCSTSIKWDRQIFYSSLEALPSHPTIEGSPSYTPLSTSTINFHPCRYAVTRESVQELFTNTLWSFINRNSKIFNIHVFRSDCKNISNIRSSVLFGIYHLINVLLCTLSAIENMFVYIKILLQRVFEYYNKTQQDPIKKKKI